MSRQTYRSEYALTVAVANYLAHRKDLLWSHIPSGEHRNAVTGAKLKRMGLIRGLPDFLIFDKCTYSEYKAGHLYRIREKVGVAIELKVGKNKTTPEQAEWLEKLVKRNWRCAVCYSLDEVVEIVEKCYGK